MSFIGFFHVLGVLSPAIVASIEIGTSPIVAVAVEVAVAVVVAVVAVWARAWPGLGRRLCVPGIAADSAMLGWGELGGTGAGVAWAGGLAATLCLGLDIAPCRRGARPVAAGA